MPNPALHVFPVSRAEFDSFRSQMNVTRDALLSRVAALEAALLAVKPTRKPSRRRRK
jgi:BMFP domain-containing protein YqiC